MSIPPDRELGRPPGLAYIGRFGTIFFAQDGHHAGVDSGTDFFAPGNEPDAAWTINRDLSLRPERWVPFGGPSVGVNPTQENLSSWKVVQQPQDPGGAWSVSGFQGGVSGRVLIFTNDGASAVTLLHESLAAPASDRIACPGGVNLTNFTAAFLVWDDSFLSVGRWRVVSSNALAAPSGITSINGDLTAAQVVAVGNSLVIAAGPPGTHTITIPDFRTDDTHENIIIGPFTVLPVNPAATNNNGIGGGALSNLTTGLNNNALGESALLHVTTGQGNVGIGNQASPNLRTGSFNTAVGEFALNAVVSGSANTGVGEASGSSITGNQNTVIGFEVALALTTGNNNTFIGYHANSTLPTASDSIALGRDATVTKSNQMALGGAPITEITLPLGGVPIFANNAAAIGGGLSVGSLYRTGGDPDFVAIVH